MSATPPTPSATSRPAGGGPDPHSRPADEQPRPERLIRSESTTEIPVHLLFRDAARQLPPPVGPRRATREHDPEDRSSPPVISAHPSAPEPEPDLVERPARVLPGALGVLVGSGSLAGAAVTAWWLSRSALSTPSSTWGGAAAWAICGAWLLPALLGFGGLVRSHAGRARVLCLFGRYRGTVRRTGLLWVNPLLRRRRVDVRLRHWRGAPMPAADASGVPLRTVLLVVWRVRDTARALWSVTDHEAYVRACVEAALIRVPLEAAGEARDVAGSLTRLVAEEAATVGLEVFSVRPVRVEYAPEVAAAMRRRRIAALDARERASVLASVVDAVQDTVNRLTARGLVDFDDRERTALVRELTVAFCAGRSDGPH